MMIYSTSQNGAASNAVPSPQPTLTSQANALLGRLDGALETSRTVTDRLLGPRPREASNDKSGSPIAVSVERLLELMHVRVGEIEEELSRANCGI